MTINFRTLYKDALFIEYQQYTTTGLGVGDMDAESSHANEMKLPTLWTRTSPRVLYDAISRLNVTQQKTVKDMGLGVLLEMTLKGIPYKLGFYVVDALDTKEKHLKVHQAVTPISIESIHEILGLPIGGINLLEGGGGSLVIRK